MAAEALTELVDADLDTMGIFKIDGTIGIITVEKSVRQTMLHLVDDTVGRYVLLQQ